MFVVIRGTRSAHRVRSGIGSAIATFGRYGRLVATREIQPSTFRSLRPIRCGYGASLGTRASAAGRGILGALCNTLDAIFLLIRERGFHQVFDKHPRLLASHSHQAVKRVLQTKNASELLFVGYPVLPDNQDN